MSQVYVQINLRPLERAIRELGTPLAQKVIQQALNHSAHKVRLVVKRNIPKRANFTAGEVHAASTLRKASVAGLTAVVTVSDPYHPASFPRFKLNPRGHSGPGSAVPSFSPWKRRERRPGAFVATMKSGHESIWVRLGKKRTPIEDVGWGPSMAREIERTDHGYDTPLLIRAEVAREFQVEFARQYNRAVARVKAKYGL